MDMSPFFTFRIWDYKGKKILQVNISLVLFIQFNSDKITLLIFEV